MDRQAMFLLALGLLIAAAAVVSVAGWILFARDRRADRSSAPESEGAMGTEPADPPEPAVEP